MNDMIRDRIYDQSNEFKSECNLLYGTGRCKETGRCKAKAKDLSAKSSASMTDLQQKYEYIHRHCQPEIFFQQHLTYKIHMLSFV